MESKDQSQKDFSTMGTESYNIKTAPEEEKIVLNIQESKPEKIIVLNKAQSASHGFYSKFNAYLIANSKVKAQAKGVFFHLLSVMINAGIPMVKALRALSMQSGKSPRLQLIIEDLANMIEEGSSLSFAMIKYPDVFTEQEIGMVESGEASGRLAQVLEILAKDADKAYQIKSKVKSALIYPVTILLLLVAVVAVMMIYVVPKLTELFSTLGEELPLLTRVVMAISNFMVGYKYAMAVGILGLILFAMLFKKTDIGRMFFDQLKIKMPIFGQLFKKAYLARMTRSLSNMIDSAVSIVKGIEITATSIGNEVYKKRLLLSVEDLKQGIPLAENLMQSDLFPPMLVNMIEVGEKTAQLGEISDKLAIFYEGEVDTAVAGISKIIEPVTLILIGLTVGGVVGAIMLPIMRISDLAGGI